jgi:molecular chaperone GrpE
MIVTDTNDEKVWDEAAEAGDGVDSMPQAAPAQDLSPEEQLAAAQAEAARNLDGWQRTQAEFANARKRFEKQRAETYINANVDLVGKLLPLIDDFERALDNAPAGIAEASWASGVALVYRKMLSVLDELNVQPIPAVGEHFDPNLHEALSQETSDEYDSGFVVREMRRGYRLGDRVIRPSLVTVAP